MFSHLFYNSHFRDTAAYKLKVGKSLQRAACGVSPDKFTLNSPSEFFHFTKRSHSVRVLSASTAIIVVLSLATFLIGCQRDTDNTVSPAAVEGTHTVSGLNADQETGGKDVVLTNEFTSGPLGNVLRLIGIPPVRNVLTWKSDQVLVSPDRDTTLEAEYTFVTMFGKRVELKATMRIEAGSVGEPVVIGMEFDRETGAVTFSPDGFRFRAPASLDVEEKNLDFFVGSGIVFAYLNPNHTFELQTYRSLNVNGFLGRITMQGANIHHFSQYAFGRLN